MPKGGDLSARATLDKRAAQKRERREGEKQQLVRQEGGERVLMATNAKCAAAHSPHPAARAYLSDSSLVSCMNRPLETSGFRAGNPVIALARSCPYEIK